MQESDNILLTNLKEFIEVPSHIVTLRDIRTDQIYQLSCLIFNTLKVDYTELKNIGKAQRFRSMTKLTQTINRQLQANIQLNDIMNPTLPFIRKLFLTFITRLSVMEGDRAKNITTANQQNYQLRKQRKILKQWVQAEYICPQLLEQQKKIKYCPYQLKLEVSKNIFKRNITKQLANIPKNGMCVLRDTLIKQQIIRKKKQAEQGMSKKKMQDIDLQILQITRNNQKDWKQKQKIANKIKNNMLKGKKIQEEEKKNQEESQPMSVFQKQVQNISEENKKFTPKIQIIETKQQSTIAYKNEKNKKNEENERNEENEENEENENGEKKQVIPQNPLERIKNQCEAKKIFLQKQLQKILSVLSEKKCSIEQLQKLKKQLILQMQEFEQRTNIQKQLRGDLKKKAQKKKILLDALEGDTDIAGQVKQLQEQLSYLESQAERQINSKKNQIATIKQQGQKKLQILGDLKLKLSKIQEDYQNICEQIQQKKEIKTKVNVNKTGISRIYYNKKITEMEVRWRETQKQTRKINQHVEQIREEIRKSLYTAQRFEIEIDNITNTGKFKAQNQNITFKDIFKKCRNTFSMTIKSIQSINETKNQIQEYEMKVHDLANKDYKESIRRLEQTLSDLQKQINLIKK